jgi:hypothetical protein
VKYFFDNCISYRFARMLAALEEWEEVVALRDRFEEDIADVDLFRELKGSDYVFITYDERQRSRKIEATALRESGLTALWLGPFWAKKGFMDQAKWIITRWEKVDQFASTVVQGTCAELTERGKARPFAL